MMKNAYLLAAVAAALLAHPVWAFDGKVAVEKSASLTQRDLDQAWDHFEAAFSVAKQGNQREALKRFRQGLVLHPAELSAHLMAARLAESEGEFGVAASHWQAVAGLASPASAEADQAEGAFKRLNAKLEAGSTVRCAVFGQMAEARVSQCDQAPKQSPDASRGIVGSTSKWGFGSVRVRAYAGAPQPAARVATVIGMDGAPLAGATLICQINGKKLPGETLAIVVYLLPGAYKLGWCYGGPGQKAQGVTDVQVLPGRLYQINASYLGNEGWKDSFREMPSNRLTWRNIAPTNSFGNIDGTVPYGSN
jgi:tetratricopeptide (TPR) repeat protein